MAKKQRQEKPSTITTNNISSSSERDLVVSHGQFDLANDSQWLLDLDLGLLSSQVPSTGQNYLFNPACNSFASTYQSAPVDSNLCSSSFTAKPQATPVERDTSGQQADKVEPTNIACNFPAVSGLFPSFPDFWFEKTNEEFFKSDALSDVQGITQGLSSDVSRGETVEQPVCAEQCEAFAVEHFKRNRHSRASATQSVAPTCQTPTSENCETLWKLTDVQHQPDTSAQTHELSLKLNKKRPSDAATAMADDSDSASSDDGSMSEIEDTERRKHSDQFAAKFLELRSKGKPCNFWQYNSQSRGPKGRRIYGEITLKDFHVLDEFTDPVSQCEPVTGGAQTNKLRHGEGNDPRPNTHKLIEIGAQITQLEDEFKTISMSRGSSKEGAGRQKNKLASRICRLKKKAQHEANKVKLEGLRDEHEQLVKVIAKLVTILDDSVTTTTGSSSSCQSSLCCLLETLFKSHLHFMIAGHTSEYVNTQIEKAARSTPAGRQLT